MVNPKMLSEKKRKYKCAFNADIQKTCTYAKPCKPIVTDYKHKFHCKICVKDFSLAAGSINDVMKHERMTGHLEKSKEIESNFLYSIYLKVTI